MKISLVIREFWPLKGGLTYHALRLGQEIKSLGHTFEVITPCILKRPGGNNRFWATELSRSFLNEGIMTHVLGLSLAERLYLLPLKKLQWRPQTRRIAKAMLNHVFVSKFLQHFKDTDIVHYDGAGVEFLGFAAQRAAEKENIPFLIQPSVHIGQWGYLRVDHEFFRLADGLLAHSRVEKEYLSDVVGNRVSVHLVYNGIDDIAQGNGEHFRQRHGIQRNMILFLGRKSEDKGYFLLREAFTKVRKTFSNVDLVCIGPSDDTLPSGDGILDLGYVNEEEKANALDACDFLCVPSEGESFGLVFLEAGRACKPYLARDLALFDDLLGDNGETGLRIGERNEDGTVSLSSDELSQGLIYLLSLSAEERAAMGEAGFENATRFLWPRTRERFLEAYFGHQVLSSH